jgi:hypothetical protein
VRAASSGVVGHRADLELGEQLVFERLIADLIARFVDVTPERVDVEIENSLRRIVEALTIERRASSRP